MTTQELINYYANLLVFQYVGKPKAYATIQTVVGLVVMDQLPSQVMNAYNLIGNSPAVGVQLDVLGKYAGVTRSGNGFAGPITLDDADFLSLIKMAVIVNNSGSSLSDIQSLLNGFFPGGVFAFDEQNMHMSYLISSSVGSQNLIELFVTEGLLPKPMGVELASIIYAPTVNNFFGCCSYELPSNPFVSPLNSYEDYEMDRPFLTYQDKLIIS